MDLGSSSPGTLYQPGQSLVCVVFFPGGGGGGGTPLFGPKGDVRLDIGYGFQGSLS